MNEYNALTSHALYESKIAAGSPFSWHVSFEMESASDGCDGDRIPIFR